MTASTLERPVNADAGFIRSRIKEGDMAHALITLSRQYSRPRDAVIRELATNGLESHRAAGYAGPVEITLPGYGNPFLTVTDHGLGLDLQDITEVVGDFAGSTKRHDGQATPNHGIGSKSPFAVTDRFTMIAVKDGFRREVLFARLSDGNPGYKIITTERTVEPNGVTVHVPIQEDDNPLLWLSAARNVLYWWENDTFQLYGRKFITGDIEGVETPRYRDQIEPAVSTSTVLAMNAALVQETKVFSSNSVIVRVGTTGYSVPSGFFADLALPIHGLGYLTVEMPRDSIKVSPNRESIEDTDGNREKVYAALLEWSETISSTYLTKLEAATSSYNLFRAWAEATQVEKILTNTTHLRRVGDQYEKAIQVERHFIQYAPEMNRKWSTSLHVEHVAEMVKSRCLILDELDSRAADIIAKWRSAHGKPAVYVFADKNQVRPLINPDEIEWVTLADLKAETPAKKTAAPVVELCDTDIVERIVYVRGNNRGAVKNALAIGEVRKLLADGLPLVIGAVKDFEEFRIDYSKSVAIACASRKPKVIEEALGQKAATPASHVRSAYLQEITALDDEQKQTYVERATLPVKTLNNAVYLKRRLRHAGEGVWVSHYSDAVMDEVRKISDLGTPLNPVYASLPGMPEPKLGTELKHTVALLEELHAPSELLLKMALRADKTAAADRRRRRGKSASTK